MPRNDNATREGASADACRYKNCLVLLLLMSFSSPVTPPAVLGLVPLAVWVCVLLPSEGDIYFWASLSLSLSRSHTHASRSLSLSLSSSPLPTLA